MVASSANEEELERFTQECRTKSISQLFQIIEQLYSSRQLEKLEIVTSLYIDYFGQFQDTKVAKAMFYRAFSRHNQKPNLAIEELEALLKMSTNVVPSDFRRYTECNLERLYPKDSSTIPKIVHLLYFGVTDFYYFHYVCVKSVIEHMADYQIIIYNSGKEPTDNKYWNEIRNHSKVEIEIIEVPEKYDGFPLEYFQYKADVVRLEQLYKKGGVYLDLDIYLTKPLDNLFKNNRGLYLSFERKGTVGPPIEGSLINCFLAAKPGNGFVKLWLESFKTGLRMENWAYHIRDTNRELLNQNPHFLIKYQIELLDSIHFCPFGWDETEKFIHIPTSITSEQTYGVHLFETITQKHLIKNPLFNPDSQSATTTVNKIDFDQTEANVNPIDKLSIGDRKLGIVALTLQEYPERQKYLQEELMKHNLAERTHIMVNQLNPKPGIGCFLAHIDAIKWAQKEGFEQILILEDDIKINSNFSLKDRFHPDKLPKVWDMLYFGGILTAHTVRDKGWVCGTIWCNHAYIVHSRMYSEILNEFAKVDLKECAAKKQTIDWFYTKLFNPKYKCWLAEDQPIVQKEGYSTLDLKQKWGKNFSWDTWTLKHI